MKQAELRLMLDFGMYKGIHIDQVDDGYLHWMLNNFSESSQWQKAAAEALISRGKLKQPDRCNVRALLTDLKSCSLRRDLNWGRRIHEKAVESGNVGNKYVVTALIKMYAKCGNMSDARQVFDDIRKPDVVPSTALVLGYADNGEGRVALEHFFKMKADGCIPDSFTYVAALKACTSLAANGDRSALDVGSQIHKEIGDHLNRYVQSMLIDMYAKCGRMVEARQVFDSIRKPDVVSWNALLMGYAENGEGITSLELFSRMKSAGTKPDSVTYVSALKACTCLADDRGLERGSMIHSEIGEHLDLYVQNTLIDMYAKCGSMLCARQVFNSIQKADVISWNALLLGYAENGEPSVSLELFAKMKVDGCAANSVTYVAALKACSALALNGDKTQALVVGTEIHLEIEDRHLNLYVQNTLIDMYAKCGNLLKACQVFDTVDKRDVVSWNGLLLGYAETGQGDVSLELFSKMKTEGCEPDSLTYVAALKACTSLSASAKTRGLETGRSIHWEARCHLNLRVQNTLIDMYAKCGSMVEAREVFDSIQKPEVVSWNTLLLGYAANGEAHISLELFSKMQAERCEPNSITYVAVLKSYASVGFLSLGRKLHSRISDFNVHVVTCLVDFYAKCGSIAEARAVFDLHSKDRDITTWNALLTGYSSCGDTDSAFSLFEAMQETGFQPNGVTFVCMLLCCSHAGLASKAREYLETMAVQYRVTPGVFHYNCTLDALGRANKLNEAVAVLREMPCNPNAVTWSSLLGACSKWRNVKLGRMAFQSLVETDEKEASAYVLMRDLWEEQACVATKWHKLAFSCSDESDLHSSRLVSVEKRT